MFSLRAVVVFEADAKAIAAPDQIKLQAVHGENVVVFAQRRLGSELAVERQWDRGRRMQRHLTGVQPQNGNTLRRRSGREGNFAGWVRAYAVLPFLQPIQSDHRQPAVLSG